MPPPTNRWEHIKKLPPAQFRRLTGVKPKTFRLMVEAVKHAETLKKKPGKPHRLTPENRVLLCLEYLRDYPTYLRLAVNWGIHESSAKRIQNRVEDILVQHPEFHVPGKRRLLSDPSFEFVIVDASERPVERPKKSSERATAARNASTP